MENKKNCKCRQCGEWDEKNFQSFAHGKNI